MKEKGFSIVELLVVVSVISILLAVSIAGFPQIKANLSLIRQANNFQQDLRIAQEMALSGALYKDSSGIERQIDGYGVFVDILGLGSKKYIIYADKSPGNKQYDNSDYIILNSDFSLSEKGVKFQQINNVFLNKTSVNFSNSKIETSINQLNFGQSSAEFIFSLESDSSKTKKVIVNTAGLIEVK